MSDSTFTSGAEKDGSADRQTEARLDDEEIQDIAEIRDRDPLIFSDGNELLLAATFRHFLAIEAAARTFLAKYATLEPALNNAFAMQAIHGMSYRGETWAAELKALRNLLTQSPTPSPSQQGKTE